MRPCRNILVLATVLTFLLVACSNEPTSWEGQNGFQQSALTKKPDNPGGGGGKEKTPDYTGTLTVSSGSFILNPDYDLSWVSDPCFGRDYYLQLPPNLSAEHYISMNITAQSTKGTPSNWFNTILVSILPDLDPVDGSPDDDEITIILSYHAGERLYEFSQNDLFYWWGQARASYPDCLRMLTAAECGRYLLKLLLRQEESNPNGQHSISKGVYSSTDDPTFPNYDGIEHGYVPVSANVPTY